MINYIYPDNWMVNGWLMINLINGWLILNLDFFCFVVPQVIFFDQEIQPVKINM